MKAFASLKKEIGQDKVTVKGPAAPERKLASDLVGKTRTGEDARAWKMLIEGFSGVGKSQFLLSIPEYALEEMNQHPNDILIELIDLDDGVIPLLEEEVCPFEYQKFIQYTLCANFDEWVLAYNRAKKNLIEHKQKTEVRGWLLIDNVGKMWEWARDKFCRDSYGMTMLELLEMRRKQAIEANKRLLPTFDQLADYAVINPLHNDVMEEIKVLSGKGWFHTIWTAPMKEYDGNFSVAGQWENPFRVDYEVRKYCEGDPGNVKFFADLVPGKHRGLKRPFVHLENPTFARVAKAIGKLKELERKAREPERKRRSELLASIRIKEEPVVVETKAEIIIKVPTSVDPKDVVKIEDIPKQAIINSDTIKLIENTLDDMPQKVMETMVIEQVYDKKEIKTVSEMAASVVESGVDKTIERLKSGKLPPNAKAEEEATQKEIAEAGGVDWDEESKTEEAITKAESQEEPVRVEDGKISSKEESKSESKESNGVSLEW